MDIARDHPRAGREARPLERASWPRADSPGTAGPDAPLGRRGLRHKIDSLRAAGWRKWEAANLSAWSYLGLDPLQPASGRTRPVHRLVGLRHQSPGGAVLERMGVSRFTLSPEDGLDNVRSLLADFGLRRGADRLPGHAAFPGGVVRATPTSSAVVRARRIAVREHGDGLQPRREGDGPGLPLPHDRAHQGRSASRPGLNDLRRAGAVSLRADFVYRAYAPAEVRRRWRLMRAGQPVPGGHAANFEHGIV